MGSVHGHKPTKQQLQKNLTKMALFHFKQEMMQEQKQKQMEANGSLHIRQDIFAPDSNKNQTCHHKQPNVMLGGVNLGDIMRQTVMEEMMLIRRRTRSTCKEWGEAEEMKIN